jgi:uncharacterized protein (UPF0264 family)
VESLKVLISPIDENEALEAIAGGADIIDVKNPREGALGAGFPWIIRRVREVTSKNVEVSCTLGDLPNLPGSAALAAFGAASLGVNYVKVSTLNLQNKADAINLMQNVVKAAKIQNSCIKVVAVGFADADRAGALHPFLIPGIAQASGCDVAMLDTAVKDGKNLFDFVDFSRLKAFVDECHSYGLQAALAGSIKKQHLLDLYKTGVDIIGLRGAVCTNEDRVLGCLTKERVKKLVEYVRASESKGN